MRELTDTELAAVSGGFLNNIRQSNWNLQVPVALNDGSGSATARARSYQQNNIIFSVEI
jgi:bacteriocin-like protein